MAREGALSRRVQRASRRRRACGSSPRPRSRCSRPATASTGEKFGFPFVICARENRKEAILAAFPVRLAHTREQEIAAALAEIAKIARLRLRDAVTEE